MIKGILWDNDGVLVDTERWFYAANRALFLQHDIDLSESQFFDWFLNDHRGAWHLLAARGVGAQRIAALRAERNDIYAGMLATQANLEVAQIAGVLAACAARVPMGIVTSSARAHFDLIHRPLDLLRHFQFVVAAEDTTFSKPSPEPYLLGLERLGLPARDCLVVEDAPRGLQAALAAGLRCIVVRSALTRHYDFAGAYRVVDSVTELGEELAALV